MSAEALVDRLSLVSPAATAERSEVVGAFLAADLDEVGAACADAEAGALVEQLLALAEARRGAGDSVRRIRAVLRGLARAQRTALAEADGVAPLDLDAPGADGLVLPPGYAVRGGCLGILRETPEGPVFDAIAPRPLLIVGAAINRTTGEHLLDLAWPTPYGTTWERRTVPRAIVADRRGLCGLAGFGAPVTSGNAAQLVSFEAAFEAVNADRLAPRQVVERMGWVDLGAGARAFVVGREVLGADGDPIELRPLDGADDVIAGWRTAGTLAEWRAAVEPAIAAYPVAGLLYLAALASPLLEPLGLAPFMVDVAGETSHGKSTVLRLAASVWGDPADGAGVFGSWGATEAGLERTAATVGHLPLLLDDTQRAGGQRAADLARMLYLLASGQGKRRGSPDGVRPAVVPVVRHLAPLDPCNVAASCRHGSCETGRDR